MGRRFDMTISIFEFVERHWLGLTLALPVAIYAAWIASLVVPEVVRAVVPAVTRTVFGG
jgi:hypothetical protein